MYHFGTTTLRQSEPDFSALRHELPALDFSAEVRQRPAVREYCQYYQLDFPSVAHRFGTFQSGKYELAAQIFTPGKPTPGPSQEGKRARGTVVLLHGYIDHIGMLRHLIRHCLEQNLAVAAYDLPGHGLSSGQRMAIDDFSEYAEVFDAFLERIHLHLPEPFYFIGHSTGCAIAFEYLVHAPQYTFERLIFVAPLVRHVHWHISKIPYVFGKIFHINTVPRRYSDISSDPAFLQVLRRDPLQTDYVPFHWIRALHRWYQRIQDVPGLPVDVLILQGTRDTVVDWEYNIPFLDRKLTRTQVLWIEGGGHQLLNETPAIREKVLQAIKSSLEKNGI
jgi:alpha-beta hydrolase superfamily lysophospholipase